MPPEYAPNIVVQLPATTPGLADTAECDPSLCYADLMARWSLGETARSLRSRQPRSMRGKHGPLAETEQCNWHTRIPLDNLTAEELDRIITGSFQAVDKQQVPGNTCVRHAVEGYVRIIVRAQVPHDADQLAAYLADSGCLTQSAA